MELPIKNKFRLGHGTGREADLHEAPLWVGEFGGNENVGDYNNYIEEAA